MKPLFKILCAMTLLLVSLAGMAQKSNWEKNFPGGINFYSVSDAGIFIVGTNDALYGINPEDGKEIWKLPEFKKITEEAFNPIPFSPLAAIVDRGMMVQHAVINTVTGQVVCNTKDLGFSTVNKRFANAKLGAVLFSGMNKKGKACLMLVDAATGEKRFEVERVFDKNTEVICSEVYAINKDLFLISTTKAIYCIDARTGEEKWRSEMKTDPPVVQPDAKDSKNPFAAFGKGMNKIQAKMAVAVSSKFFQVTDPSRVYFFNNDYFTCYDWATGKEVWQRQELSSPLNNYILDDRGIIVTTNQRGENYGKQGGLMGKALGGGNKAKMYMFDYATGKQLLQDEIDVAGNVIGYNYDNTGKRIVIATANDKGSNKIDIIDVAAGKEAIRKPLRVSGNIRDIKLVSKGLLYITDEEINIMDLETGGDAWGKSIKVKDYVVHGFKDENTMYMAVDGDLIKFDVATSTPTKIGSVSLDGKESPSGMQFVNGGLVLSSSQNIRYFDLTGKEGWKVYRPAPGVSLAGKIALGVVAAASVAMMAANSYQAGYAAAGGATYKGQYMSNQSAADSYARDADNWGAIAVASFQAMNKRFKATRTTATMQSILTKTDDGKDEGVGIEIYNKETGSKEGAVVLRDKKPEYFFDDIGRIVFWKRNDNSFTGVFF
ncbi:MAG TPA: PQQ-binding-like beta-propeller repeat protein [Phnomibacter sp.]|nr:PQQ-binding-like beta-propeller repeat protein [Phnomibacter sp.]